MAIHGHLPDVSMNSVLVPIIKDKCGDVASQDNYRAIVISPIVSKLLELVILERYID